MLFFLSSFQRDPIIMSSSTTSLKASVASQYLSSLLGECTDKMAKGPTFLQSALNLLFVEQQTVPFVARYRKEQTGNLDEVELRDLSDLFVSLVEREERRHFVLETIGKMDKLDDELKKKILAAKTIQEIEDLYAPYKVKRKTKATEAREKNLGLLFDLAINPQSTWEVIKKEAEKLCALADAKVKSVDEALKGLSFIAIEEMSHHVEGKKILRERFFKEGVLQSKKKNDAEKENAKEEVLKYQDFFDYQESVESLKQGKAFHRFMALKRGMTEGILDVEVDYPLEAALGLYKEFFWKNHRDEDLINEMNKWAQYAYKYSLKTSLDLEVKSELKKMADEASISIFASNLRELLLAPYLGPKVVMGVDPGIRTGCKIAIIDETGKFLLHFTIYLDGGREDKGKAREEVEKVIKHFKITHIGIGNGTYARETLKFFKEEVPFVKENGVHVALVSESGASIYSASEIARSEFPDLDLTVRGAISIARRAQNPLAELVKIDPKSIGVGQYQHDVNQVKLKKSLEGVVESCVNYVGVDLNTASFSLLSFVSGIGPALAKKIVSFRDKTGRFKLRSELLKVPHFSEKVFEQAAGFLRIVDGEMPLDATFVHPERYSILEEWVLAKGISLHELCEDKWITVLASDKNLKEKLGEFTFADIVKSLQTRGQDPRLEFVATDFDETLSSFQDLVVGKTYQGEVANITQFGAFVDIGLKEKGLIHISEMSDSFVDDPFKVLKVGQQVKARVLSVDRERKRIALSLKKQSRATSGVSETKSVSSPKLQRPAEMGKNNAFAKLKNFPGLK